MLVLNDEKYLKRAEIIWEKGTNRAEFYRGEVNKYGWVDTGSSFLPSEIIAAYLYAQVENLDAIQNARRKIWDSYFIGLQFVNKYGVILPIIPDYATNNGHMFYLVCSDLQQRTLLIEHLKREGIYAVFHYLSLHKSLYYHKKHDGRQLPNSDLYADCLIRLPLFYELTEADIAYIIKSVKSFLTGHE
jgi:dTDP-4-amino-4,6-dideoxygalactose transaminase